jgi:hypothetical protein
MGWTTTDRRDDVMTDREFIEFYELRGVEVLDHAKAGTTHFFVYKSPTTGEVSVIVALTTKCGHEFSVKILDESVGPADDRCPRRILDQLGTPPNEWAAQWRQRCHHRRATASKTTLKAGDVIRFAAPINSPTGTSSRPSSSWSAPPSKPKASAPRSASPDGANAPTGP